MIRDKYLNLFTDFGFKKVFGEEGNKDLLIDFLNQVLPSNYQIESLEFSKNEQLGQRSEDRRAVFDLHCISSNKERFIVELQKAKQQFFKDRSLYYATFPIVEQAEKGKDWNYRLDPVFMIGVLNFSFEDSAAERFRHHVMLRDEKCEVFYDKLHFIYLEVAKFTKTLQQCSNRFEKWLWIFKNLPSLDEIPKELMNDLLVKVFKIAEVAQLSPVEQDAYQQSLKYLWDLHNVVDTAFVEGKMEGREEGEQIGLEKGEQIGERKKALETACKMLKDGLTTETISKYTGLSVGEIRNLDCNE